MNNQMRNKKVFSDQKSGKPEYKELVKAQAGRVFAICLGMLGNIHDAEDIAQQTLLKCLTNIRQVRDGNHFDAWIGRIAKNLCVDFIRRQKSRRNAFFKHYRADHNNMKNYPELQCALTKLPEQDRIALMLYYFDGRNVKSVARTLTISEAAAQARLSRARKKLRKLLEAEEAKK